MANPVVVEKDMVYIYGANEYWWGGTVGEEIKYEKCCAANFKKTMWHLGLQYLEL